MEIKLYFKMLQRGWWVVLLTGLIAVASSLIFTYFTTPQYQATARFIITPNSSLQGGAIVDGLDVLDRITVMTTYAEVMNSERVYSDTLKFLGLSETQLEGYTKRATVLSNTSIIELSVTGPNPNVITALANTLGYTAIDFARRMNQPFDINFLDMAMVPTLPVSPQPIQDATVAFALGLIGGAALVILREQLRIPLEAYRQRSRIDAVTGVYNYRHFPRMIDDVIAKHPRELHTVGFVELSGMRDLLETLPVASINLISKTVTSALKKELRGNDVIGRWNDNTFAVLLPSTSGASANTIFERIYQTLSTPIDLQQLGTSVNLDPHVGGAEYSNDITLDELLKKAESALQNSRRDNTNPVYVWKLKNPFWTTAGGN